MRQPAAATGNAGRCNGLDVGGMPLRGTSLGLHRRVALWCEPGVGTIRHVLHAVTNPNEILDEMLRVLKPGGRLHVLPEDYGMIHDSSSARELDRLWQAGWIEAGRNTGIDLCIGRKLPAMLLQRRLCDVQTDFVVIDSLRVDRTLLTQVFAHWRDLAGAWLTDNTSVHRSELRALFAGFLAIADDPAGYVVWQVPIVSAVKPASG